MINMTDIPDAIGNLFNIPSETGGVLISVLILTAVLTALSLLNQSMIAMTVTSISVIALFTFLGWFPIWITILITLGLAVMFGRSVVSKSGGGAVEE